MKNKLILKNNAKWKPYYTKTTTIKTNVAKISACSVTSVWQCYKFSTRMCMESWVIWGCRLEWGDSENLHSSFSVPEWSTCYFSFLLWVTYQAGRVLKISIIMMGVWVGGGGGSTVKFSKLVVKKNGKENRQQLVKMITCLNFGLKVHSNLKPSDKQFVLQQQCNP